MKNIPISAMKKFARDYGCDHIIMLCTTGPKQHVATYGSTVEQCDQAAQFGDKLKDGLGWPESLHAIPPRVKKFQSELASVQKDADEYKAEVKSLRLKTSEQERFIWWIWNVYSKNVNDLILSIISATTYDNETMAKLGKYGLPIKCFEILERVKEGTDRIYDGTYLDAQMSTNLTTSSDNNKLDMDSLEYAAKWIENSLVGETNARVVEFGKNMAMSIRAAKTGKDGEE